MNNRVRVLSSHINTYTSVAGFIFAAMIILYIFFVGSTAFWGAESEKLSESVGSLSTELGDIESRYLSLSGQIDMDFARSLGFVDHTKETHYVIRGNAFTVALIEGNGL